MAKQTNEPDRPAAPPPVEPISLAGIRTTPFADRRHLVSVERFAGTPAPGDGVAVFLESLPHILAGQAFRNLVRRIVEAHRAWRGVVVALGAHVIKCGLSPVLIDLLKRRVVTALALNGAGAIHDYEIAFGGRTSEDVVAGLDDGSFGMAAETGLALEAAAERGVRQGIGLGAALGRLILEAQCPFAGQSLLATAAQLGVPATVHVAIGTDTVHMHAAARGAAIGESSHLDFRILAAVVANLDGGVWMNVGSAVILPEVFLKAVTVAHNLGTPLANLVTANLDFERQYRPQTNVVERPSAVGITLIGHHEVLLPLLRMAVLVALEGGGGPAGAQDAALPAAAADEETYDLTEPADDDSDDDQGM